MRRFAPIALPALLLAMACQPRPAAAPETPAVDTAATAQGLATLRNDYITHQTAGHAEALAAVFADSAGLDLFGLPRLRGRAAIQTALAADFAARKYPAVEITPSARAYRTATEATELGTYHDTHDVNGKVDHEWGRYVGVFRKEADGSWKITYLMAFPDSTRGP